MTGAAEESIPISHRHLQEGAGFGLGPPFLGPCADGLAGELGNCSGVAGVGHTGAYGMKG